MSDDVYLSLYNGDLTPTGKKVAVNRALVGIMKQRGEACYDIDGDTPNAKHKFYKPVYHGQYLVGVVRKNDK